MLSASEMENGSAHRKVSVFVYWLMLFGLLLRIVFALNAQNIDHPDEIFQYLEPAHRLVFGYGFITWEYRFGTRCWLIPLFVSLPLFLCQSLGLADPAVYVPLVKCLLCLLSTSLIFTSYIIARSLLCERAGLVAAILCTVWYELIYFSGRPLADVVAAYFLLGALAFLVDRCKRGRPVLFGICAATAALLRTQYAPISLFLTLVAAFKWQKQQLLPGLLSLVLCLLLGGFVDYLTWGSFFASTIYSFLFNGTYNVGVLFTAARPPLWYLESLLSTSALLLPVAFCASLYFYRSLWIPTGCVTILLLSHSLVPSKEYRYIFACIPLLLILSATLIEMTISAKIPQQKARAVLLAVSIFFAGVSICGYQNWLPNEASVYRFKPLSQGEAGIESFNFLAREKDVAGILIDRRLWWQTGGYYCLHHAVPLYQPQVDFKNCSEADPYISHMVCPADNLCPGFQPLATFRGAAVGKNLKERYETFPGWNRNLWQPGIDGKYEPRVHSFLDK